MFQLKFFLKRYWIILLLILMFLLFSKFIFLNGLLLWDEPVYLGNARSHIADSHFTEDFRFPLLELVIGFVWFIFGESVILAQFIIVIFSLLSIYAVYLLSKLMFKDSFLVFLMTLSYSLFSSLIYWGFRIYTDVPALTFMLFAIYFFFKYRISKNVSLLDLFFSGIFTSLAFLMKFSVVLYSFMILVYLIHNFLSSWKFSSKFSFSSMFSLFSYFIGNFIILLPWLIYNFFTYHNFIWDLSSQSSVISAYTSWQSPLLFFHFLILSFGLLLLFLIPYIVSFFKTSKTFFDYFNLILIVITLLFHLFYVRLKLARYLLVIYPFILFAIVSGASYLVNLFSSKKYFLWIKYFVYGFIIVLSLFFAFNQIIAVTSVLDCPDNAVISSIDYIEHTVSSKDYVVSNSWPWYGYYGNHYVRSLWSDDLDEVFFNVSVSKLIYSHNGGLIINESSLFKNNRLVLDKVFEDSCNNRISVFSVV